MAQFQWNRVSVSSAGLVLLLQLALSVLTVGDVGGVCPSYPADPTWKNSMSAQEMSVNKFSKKMNLRLVGTFKQGAKVLLHKPVQEDSVEPVQAVKMAVSKVNPSNSRGVYKVSVILTLGFQPSHSQFNYPVIYESGKILPPGTGSKSQDVKIVGNGTFDEATGELCVLACIVSVCKYKLSLKYPTPKTFLDVFVEGNLTSVGGATDKTYFDPVSIHAIADSPSDYTMNATLERVCPNLAPDVKVGKLWNVEEDDDDDSDRVNVCEEWHRLNLEPIEVTWNPECEGANCSPFAELGHAAGGNTSFLRAERFACHDNRMQANLVVANSQPFFGGPMLTDPSASDGTLLAEGVWDFKAGQMCMIACRLYGKQDCEIAITLQFPLTFTVTQRSSAVGHIYSLRKETDPSYFKMITFRTISQGSLQGVVIFSDSDEETTSLTNSKNQPEYAYTKVETAKALCSANLNEKKSGIVYPTGEDWSDLDLLVVKDLRSPETKVNQPNFYHPWQSMKIFTRGSEFVVRTLEQLQHNSANVTGLGVTASPVQDRGKDGIMNVSYSMDYQIGPREEHGRGKIVWHVDNMAGEGFYDSNTGKLCLIGCRAVDLKQEGLQQKLEGDAQNLDCQTLFSLQLPPIGSATALRGTVKSLRPPIDPLYFKPESFSGMVNMQAADSLWRIDLEIVLSILMLSLTVVFLFRQVRYSKRHPETLPYISISMLLLLSLAHIIPLVVDFEALFQRSRRNINVYLMMAESVGGWPEVNKVVVRFITMAAMLLQLRLLQLVWKSRTEARVTGKLAPQERRLLYYIVPLYAAGGLIAILAHAMLRFKPYEREFLWRSDQGGVWWDVHAYCGLLLDLHLLPQVTANILWDTAELQAPLSKWLYVGMAIVRSVPHIYDVCRQFRFIPLFSDMYLYANPEWNFYSLSSDILIPSFVLLLAFMVSLQQRWGGRCVLPRRWRTHLEKLEYERVEDSIADFTL